MNRKQQAAYNKAYKIEVNNAIWGDAGTGIYYNHFNSMEELAEFKTYPVIYNEIAFETLVASRKRAAKRARPNDRVLYTEQVDDDVQLNHIITTVTADSKLAGSFGNFTGLKPILQLRDSLDEAEFNVRDYIDSVTVKKVRGRYMTQPHAYKTGVLKAIGRAGFTANAAALVLDAGVKAGIWVVEKETHGSGEWHDTITKYRVGIVGHHTEKRHSQLRHWDWELRSEQEDYYMSHDKKGNYIPPDKRW